MLSYQDAEIPNGFADGYRLTTARLAPARVRFVKFSMTWLRNVVIIHYLGNSSQTLRMKEKCV